jgi:BON domain
MKRNLWVVLISMALLATGCSRVGERTDAQIQSDVQSKISADSNVPDKQLSITTSGGIVTLAGNVSSDAARTAAASDAGQIAGVKTVINNLQVTPATAATQPVQPQEQAANNPPPSVKEERRPSPAKRNLRPAPRSNSATDSGSNSNDNSSNPAPAGNSGNDVAQSSAPPPAPVAPPVPQKVTVPSGTQLSIRLNDEVDSEKAQVGDIFHGSLSAPITIDDDTVLPTTADVEGRVVDVKSAGKFAGQSVLTLELTKLVMNGRTYSIHTDQWTKSGTGRGKSTAAKVGGGAAVGAILGGILGGGKGAAIGATAGAGAGTGVSAVGKGQQIVLHAEQVIAFQLQNPLTVTPVASRPAMNQ